MRTPLVATDLDNEDFFDDSCTQLDLLEYALILQESHARLLEVLISIDNIEDIAMSHHLRNQMMDAIAAAENVTPKT